MFLFIVGDSWIARILLLTGDDSPFVGDIEDKGNFSVFFVMLGLLILEGDLELRFENGETRLRAGTIGFFFSLSSTSGVEGGDFTLFVLDADCGC